MPNNEQGSTQAPQMSTVRDYFTPEVNSRIASLTNENMVVLLKELEGSPFWTAILRYNQQRLSFVQSLLFSADPVNDPSGMRLNQGIMLGISDLQNSVITLVTPAPADPTKDVMGR